MHEWIILFIGLRKINDILDALAHSENGNWILADVKLLSCDVLHMFLRTSVIKKNKKGKRGVLKSE